MFFINRSEFIEQLEPFTDRGRGGRRVQGGGASLCSCPCTAAPLNINKTRAGCAQKDEVWCFMYMRTIH